MDTSFGRYRLLERLGKGGMAEVFKAKSFGVEGFEKTLVIKRILPELSHDSSFVNMFIHEAKLAVRLSHANIVQVFDLGRIDVAGDAPAYFMAMEYVAGLDLASALFRCRRLNTSVPLGLAVYIAAEIAKALDHAHRKRDEYARPLGIVHRDISPQNVLLSWEGEVKVTDFGIAKAKDGITAQQSTPSPLVHGKLAYMSPEQSRGHELDARSDLFSLGSLLYEMIAGANPFAAPAVSETRRRLQSCEYPPLEVLRPETPKLLSDITTRLLTREPPERFADAGVLHEQLLGYFYSSKERFGAHALSEFLAPFREPTARTEVELHLAFEEHRGGIENTPVEIPKGGSSASHLGMPIRTPVPPSGRDTNAETPFGASGELSERREVTALVVGLSPMRGSLPHGTRHVPIASPLERARAVLLRHGGHLMEEEPNHLAALFGLGDADGRDTEAAVRAALVILRMVGPSASIGINVGRIVVDAQGAPAPSERLVSLIASAQALCRASEGQVVVSSLAAHIIRDAFVSVELPPCDQAAPEGARVIHQPRPRTISYGQFVGRNQELKYLGELLAQATRKKAQMVTIMGDKGVGKTRLIAEMNRRLVQGNYDIGFFVANCPTNGATSPLSALTAMLQVLCGVQEGDGEERLSLILPRLRALGLQEEECQAVLVQLGASLADPWQASSHPGPELVDRAPLSRAPIENISGSARALGAAFARMVHSLCADRFHVFAWDDAHAMDPATLAILLGCIERAASHSARMLFLFGSRVEPPGSIREHYLHTSVLLGELSEDDSARLISTRLGARLLSPELLSFCRERAGGHPLFIEELVKELSESGGLEVQDGAVMARLDGSILVPRTLRTLIAARVSRLPPQERIVLSAAAIMAEPIDYEVLAALVQQLVQKNAKSAIQMDRSVRSLIDRGLLRSLSLGQVSFASPMHGEIVLDAIPNDVRPQMHSSAAAAYVGLFGEDSSEHAARIGEHLYQSGERDRAAGFFARVALSQTRTGQLEPAMLHLFRALELAETDQRSPQELGSWLSSFALTISRLRSAPEIQPIVNRMLRRIDSAGTVPQKVQAHVDAARIFSAVNRFERANEFLHEAARLSGIDHALGARVLAGEVELATRSGDYARAQRAAEAIETIGFELDPGTLLLLARVHSFAGRLDSAIRLIDRAAELTPADDWVAASVREKDRTLAYLTARDFKAASDTASRCVDLCRSAGLRAEAAVALHNLGDASCRLGDLARAYACFVESRDIADALGSERLAALNRAFLAYLDGLGGDSRADQVLNELIDYADCRAYVTDGLESRLLLACLRLRQGAEAEARQRLIELSDLAQTFGNQLIAGDVRELLGSSSD